MIDARMLLGLGLACAALACQSGPASAPSDEASSESGASAVSGVSAPEPEWLPGVRALIDGQLFDEAYEQLSQRVRADPGDYFALCVRGECEVQLLMYEEAAHSLERAREVEPLDAPLRWKAWLRYELGYLKLEFLGTPAEGLASFDEALSLDPRHFKALQHRAHAHQRLGAHEQAARDYRNALESWKTGDDFGDWLQCSRSLADSLRELGRVSEAEAVELRAQAAVEEAGQGG